MSHLPLHGDYDEPETLSYQAFLVGPISADVDTGIKKPSGHSRLISRTAVEMTTDVVEKGRR